MTWSVGHYHMMTVLSLPLQTVLTTLEVLLSTIINSNCNTTQYSVWHNQSCNIQCCILIHTVSDVSPCLVLGLKDSLRPNLKPLSSSLERYVLSPDPCELSSGSGPWQNVRVMSLKSECENTDHSIYWVSCKGIINAMPFTQNVTRNQRRILRKLCGEVVFMAPVTIWCSRVKTHHSVADGINVKKQSLYTSVIDSHIQNSKIGTVNLVVEHIVTTPTCSTTKFTVPILLFWTLVYKLFFTLIFAIFLYNTVY